MNARADICAGHEGQIGILTDGVGGGRGVSAAPLNEIVCGIAKRTAPRITPPRAHASASRSTSRAMSTR